MFDNKTLTINDTFFEPGDSFLSIIKLSDLIIFMNIVNMIGEMKSLFLLTNFTNYSMLLTCFE